MMEHAIGRFKDASEITHIKNPVDYLKVLIYNSINEMDRATAARVRYYK